MARAQAVETIRCTPEEFLEFVMDVECYAEVDDKIRPVDRVCRDGDVTEFRFRPAMPGLPRPAPRVVSRMRLTPGQRVDIGYAPWPRNRLTHLTTRFGASFACEPVDGGTRVTRTVRVDFRPPLCWLVEPVLRTRLPANVAEELRLAKDRLER